MEDIPKYYFKKTWCGMVLMVLKIWDNDGKEMKEYVKADEVDVLIYLNMMVEG